MSQHCFSTQYRTRTVTVILGWDRPLGHYFMVIEGADEPENGSDGIVYSNLDEAAAFGLDLAHFRDKLADLGVQVPAAIFEEIARDRRNHVGNRCVWYRPDGSFADTPA